MLRKRNEERSNPCIEVSLESITMAFSLFLTQFLENKRPILNCNDAREESQE